MTTPDERAEIVRGCWDEVIAFASERRPMVFPKSPIDAMGRDAWVKQMEHWRIYDQIIAKLQQDRERAVRKVMK